MHIAVVGAGVLGSIYGAHLVAFGDRVTFVVRPGHRSQDKSASGPTPISVERVGIGKSRLTIEKPNWATEIPSDADVVLITVRFEQLLDDPSLGGLLRALPHPMSAPAVVLTPMLPSAQLRLQDQSPMAIVPAMPGVVGYTDASAVVRFWVPIVANTLIDDLDITIPPNRTAPAARGARDDLARHLTDGGLPTRLERGVGRLNAATTTAFFPLIAAIDAGGGLDGALADKQLLELTLEATKECQGFARSLGRQAPWARFLTKFVGPFTLAAGVGLGRRLYPESVGFVDQHFGAKLHEQHLAMGREILQLASEHGEELTALRQLMDRVVASARSCPNARQPIGKP